MATLMINRYNPTREGERGFTLVELIIVMAILALLAALTLPLITGRVHGARVTADQANVRMLQGLADIWVVDNAGKTGPGLHEQNEGDWIMTLRIAGLLREKTIEHPFGREYRYELIENRAEDGEDIGWEKYGYTVKSSAQGDKWDWALKDIPAG
ncbi:MAG: prepilin-type N-terminal cleavage/methylation domain-containing protein [Firmicutes bacterium]|nr:prepilin-type N-terminal cleavage/methylation domain-containing protein [Bacillota bacterium]